MFNKFLKVCAILGATSIAYFFIIIVVPWLAGVASTANTTISASSNMSNYPGLSGALLASPLWLYFVPALIAIALVVFVLREPMEQ